jgi:hypothetical protein
MFIGYSSFMILEHPIRTLGDGKSKIALSLWAPRERVDLAGLYSTFPEDFIESRPVI